MCGWLADCCANITKALNILVEIQNNKYIFTECSVQVAVGWASRETTGGEGGEEGGGEAGHHRACGGGAAGGAGPGGNIAQALHLSF